MDAVLLWAKSDFQRVDSGFFVGDVEKVVWIIVD